MRPPDIEYFWFKLQYKHSQYSSRDYDGYFDTWSDANNASSKIIAFHKKKIEDLGDVFEPQQLVIYRVSAPMNPSDPTPDWIKW